jgi:hypothetical protein
VTEATIRLPGIRGSAQLWRERGKREVRFYHLDEDFIGGAVHEGPRAHRLAQCYHDCRESLEVPGERASIPVLSMLEIC